MAIERTLSIIKQMMLVNPINIVKRLKSLFGMTFVR